jgi:subtilisin family serine protease
MNTRTIWRWSGLLIVVTMIVSMATAPVGASPVSAPPQNATAAPVQQILPKEVGRSIPQKPPSSRGEGKSDEALVKLAPELRPLAKARSSEVVLVTVLMRTGTKVEPYFQRVVVRKPIGGLQWATGEISGANLLKLAGLSGVISVVSFQSYAPVPAPNDDFRGGIGYQPPSLKLEKGKGAQVKEALRKLTAGMSPEQVREKLRTDPAFRAKVSEILGRPLPQRPALPEKPSLPPQGGIQPATIKVKDVHGASAAWTKGYTGTGVVAAVVDTGVDFAHPDLQGTQARVPSGPYAGWPYSYDTLSGLFYAFGYPTIGPDTYWDVVGNTYYAHTLPVESPTCNGITCTANLKIDFGSDAGWPWPPVVLPFVWPDTSKSGQYYYTVHPDLPLLEAGYYLGLGYAYTDIAPAAVIVADENTAGVYDTVYVDADFDQDLTNNKPMRKGDELAGVDLYDAAGNPGTDGIWDLSAGMLAWIADGANVPPGTGVLYMGLTVPAAGRLLAFIGDDESHGTNCAGDIVAQGVITDPEWIGPINPIFGGAENYGGVGGPVLSGMAPGAKIAAFQHGFWLPFDSWVLAALGFDGVPNTGDEAQISSNSWGASATINDGWDATSRFAHWLNRNYAPNLAFLVATGNGGHGYGTVTEPDGGSIIDVGASTQYGTLIYFEPITDTTMLTYGDVQPWSNRGPTTLGDVSPDVVAVGAWGTGANPLNIYAADFASNLGFWTGQAAYDIFGGTSMATPIAAGNLALVYQAFKAKNGRWPTWQEAKAIFLSGATDLGYDVLTQGSGNVNANRATDIAAGLNYGYWAEPAQWTAGSYRGTDYPAFPAILHPGQSDSQTFTLHNTYTGTFIVNIADTMLMRVAEVTFTLSFPSFDPPPFTRPTWITDITDLINTYDPDLIRAQVIFPYGVFDPEGDYAYNNRWRVMFYGWKDLNGDGNLWTDTNGNGRVDAGEIDAYEYNRFTYGYPSGTYLEASLGKDSYSRWLDPAQTAGNGIFFGVQRRSGSAPVTMQVRITFYKKADWGWLTTSASSVSLPAGGNATFNATLSVPADAKPGVYEGAIEVSHASHKTVIPVVVHVAANSPTFSFGASSPDEPIGDTPYDNGHLFGGFDWDWRYESGDWKLYYFDLPSGTAGPGKAMVVDTRWTNPAPSPPPPTPIFYEDFEGAFPPSGWTVVNNGGDCVWQSTATTGRPNFTGGAGDAADADSDRCGPGTTMDTELRTPPIDLSGVTQAWLMFKSDFNDYQNQDHGYVDISTDGGATWTTLLHYDRADYRTRTEIINLTPYVGSANTIIRFRYVAPGWDWWWEVDEVGIYLEEPTPPPPTDVDTWIYAAAPDFYSTSDPAFFGPQSVERVGGSNDTNIGAGIFTFDTATGGPREVVAGEIRDGLGFIALHNVLYAGTQLGEPIVGQAYQVQASPAPVVITTSNVVNVSPIQFGDSWVESFTSAYTLTEGLGVLTFGLSQPQSWENVNLPPGPTVCDWSYSFSVANGGLIEATAWSTNIADIDLYLFGPVSASSTTPTAWEQVRVKRPPDGTYQVCVDNWSGTPGTFNLILRVIQGTDLVVSGVPTGTINANTPVTFTVTFTKTAAPGTTWEGLLYLGPAAAPTAIEIPVTVNIITPTFGLNLAPPSASQSGRPGEVVTYTLMVTNTGNITDTFNVAVSGNAWTTNAPATVGPVAAGASATFQVTVTIPTGVTGADSDTATVTVTSRGDNSKTAQATLTTRRVLYRLFLPVVMRNYGP